MTQTHPTENGGKKDDDDFEIHWKLSWRKLREMVIKMDMKLPIGVCKYTYDENGNHTEKIDYKYFIKDPNTGDFIYRTNGKRYTREILDLWDYCLSITKYELTSEARKLL